MLLDENDSDFPGSGPKPSESVSYVDFVRNHKEQGLIMERKSKIKGMLDSEEWHRPYAEALMETDPAKLVRLIGKAERAIFGRYLELCMTPAAIEQGIDLRNAVYCLSQLKKANRSPKC